MNDFLKLPLETNIRDALLIYCKRIFLVAIFSLINLLLIGIILPIRRFPTLSLVIYSAVLAAGVTIFIFHTQKLSSVEEEDNENQDKDFKEVSHSTVLFEELQDKEKDNDKRFISRLTNNISERARTTEMVIKKGEEKWSTPATIFTGFPPPTVQSNEIEAKSLSATAHTFFLSPNKYNHKINSELELKLREWLPNISKNYDWYLSGIRTTSKFVVVTIVAPSNISSETILNTIRTETSELIFKEFKHYGSAASGVDFWGQASSNQGTKGIIGRSTRRRSLLPRRIISKINDESEED